MGTPKASSPLSVRRWPLSMFVGRAISAPPDPAASDAHTRVPLPRTGCRLAEQHGCEWVVHAVRYDEAGPECVAVISRQDLDAARLAAVLWLGLHAWCEFCQGKTVLSEGEGP